jgi:hypothetical protein
LVLRVVVDFWGSDTGRIMIGGENYQVISNNQWGNSGGGEGRFLYLYVIYEFVHFILTIL